MRLRLAMILSLLIGSVGCDQATKSIAIESLKGEPTRSFFLDVFRLTYAENAGAFLGLGATWPDTVRLTLLAGFVPVLLAGLLIAALSRRASLQTALALTLLVGGGLGNLIDRLLRDGRVVDFMNLGVGPIRTGIFNVADVQLMVGVGLLMVWSFTTKHAPLAQGASEPTSSAS